MAEVELPNVEEIEENRQKSFTRRVALTTAVFAVILAIASLGGNNATKEMLLAQQKSSDQWAHYQAKAIREHLYRTQKMRLNADLLERGKTMDSEVRREFESLLSQMGDEESRLHSDKKELEEAAKRLEHERDVNMSRDPYFDYAEALLQIAIVMSSISILALSRPIYYFAIITAILGVLLTINGYSLIFRVPFFNG